MLTYSPLTPNMRGATGRAGLPLCVFIYSVEDGIQVLSNSWESCH